MTSLAQDSKGKPVGSLQKTLNGGGAKLRIDEDFGAKTKVALLQAQRVLKKSPTGTVEMSTLPASATVPAGKIIPVDTFISSKFPAPWLSQRDNWKNPSGTCNVTSCAMALAWLGSPIITGGKQLEDSLFEEINGPEAMKIMKKNFKWALDAKTPPQQVLGMLEWLLKRHGVAKAKFSTEATRDSILKALDTTPVILSGKFTKSGHIVIAVGKTQADDLIVNDPWGDWTTGYANSNGAARVYPVEKIWTCLDKGAGKCWALTVG